MSGNQEPCALCHSANTRLLASVRDVEYFTSEDLFDYYGCDDCGSIFLKDPPVERLPEIYPDTYYSADGGKSETLSLNSFMEIAKSALDKRLFRRILRKIPGDSLSCIDIGGGSGWLMNVVRDADKRVMTTTVLDISEKPRAAAQASGHRYLNQPVETLQADEEFDLILMMNLIEHVADPRRVLKAFRRAMTPSGRLLIKTPNTLCWNRSLFEGSYWGGYHAPRHWVLFNKESFCRTALECGLAVESFSYTQGAPQWVASILGTREMRHPGTSRKPMYTRPVASLLMLFFACFDFLRLPLFRTDQMIIVLRRT